MSTASIVCALVGLGSFTLYLVLLFFSSAWVTDIFFAASALSALAAVPLSIITMVRNRKAGISSKMPGVSLFIAVVTLCLLALILALILIFMPYNV